MKTEKGFRDILIAMFTIVSMLRCLPSVAQKCALGEPLKGDPVIESFYREARSLPVRDQTKGDDQRRLQLIETLFNRDAYYGETYDNPAQLYVLTVTEKVLREQTPRIFDPIVKLRLFEATTSLIDKTRPLVDNFEFVAPYSYTQFTDDNICDRERFVGGARSSIKSHLHFDYSSAHAAAQSLYCALHYPPINFQDIEKPEGFTSCGVEDAAIAPAEETNVKAKVGPSIASVPVSVRLPTEKTPTSDSSQSLTGFGKDNSSPNAWQLPLLIGLLIAFVLMFAVAHFIPDPTPSQAFLFRMILAIIAGGFGALLPGEFRLEKTGVTATGAVGVFMLVYLVNPATLGGNRPNQDNSPNGIKDDEKTSKDQDSPPPPPKPKPASLASDDIQKDRWGNQAEGWGRRIYVTNVQRFEEYFVFDAVLESIDGVPLEGPVYFHLHDTFTPSKIKVTKMRDRGRQAIREGTLAEGTFTLGVQFRDLKREWRSLEYDLASYDEGSLMTYDSPN